MRGPKGWERIRSLRGFFKDSLEEYERLFATHGDSIHAPLNENFFLFFHPDHVETILRKNAKNYIKATTYKEFYPLLGQGLVTSDGELWKKQRQLIGPEFRPSFVQNFFPVMKEVLNQQVQIWMENFSKENKTQYEFSSELTSLTFKMMEAAFFGTEVHEQSQIIQENFLKIAELGLQRVFSPLKFPAWFPSPSQLQTKRAVQRLDEVFYQVVQQSQNFQNTPAPPLLSRLLAAQMPLKQLRDEVMTLMLAGHETTSNALIWTLILIGQHPQIKERAVEEVQGQLGGREIEWEDLERCPFVKATFLEAMRIYPPVPHFARTPLQEETIGEFSIPAKSIVLLVPYITHKHPDFWERPQDFLPERFMKRIGHETHPFAYFPFSGGPRGCVGETMAMMEGILILMTFLQRFDFRLIPRPNFPIIPHATITMRPKHGVLMEIRPK